MSVEIIGLLAETYVHSGTGQAVGAIDLPVARERTTHYPFIPGSSMKGALLDVARGDGLEVNRLFGQQENAGQLLISDARLLLLPVRSLRGPYCWLTCPYLLERLRRDLNRCDKSRLADVQGPSGSEKALAADQGELFLEERLFAVESSVPDELVRTLTALIPHEDTRRRLPKQLAIVTDDDFAWFAQYALPVQARNVLHEEKKTSENLWYEEALPPDTLMYLVVGERSNGAAGELAGLLSERRYLQTGGNETVGQGWFAVQRLDGSLT